MASSLVHRRPHALPVSSRRTDEECINRSLLEILDAQDAEPLSSSDSDVPAPGSGTASTPPSSVTSPSLPFHVGPSHFQRSDSPNILSGAMKSPHALDSFHHSQSLGQSVYNSMQAASDYSTTLSDQSTPKQYEKANGFGGPFRTSTAFNAFSHARPRHSSVANGSSAYRDAFSTYPNANDGYAAPAHPSGPTYEPAHGSGRTYEFGVAPHTAGLTGKASYGSLDPYASGLASSVLAPSMGKNGGLVNGAGTHQRQSLGGYHASAQYSNGLASMQSQTPFGPHLPAGAGGPPAPSASLPNVTASVPSSSQEEISTIFVVGFPDDMQEREFQNMFTFSPGFEAATLKIPNKELTSYGTGVGALRAGGFPYAGSNDPYNSLTVNQGGVLVDNGRDGTTTSWPSALAPHDEHYMGTGPAMPPRKQIIGFAKFRTRQEALEAREVLQGRRVDAEKGAMLKAEMAKKNLHTKRGVGQPGLLSAIGGGAAPGAGADTLAGMGSFGNLNAMLGSAAGTGPGGEALSARERELGALGAMGFGGSGARRERALGSTTGAGGDADDERERSRMDVLALPAMFGTRGPRERAEEDERERRRKEKERLRSSNSSAFDAFHSVPPHARNATATALATGDEGGLNGYGGMQAHDGYDGYELAGWSAAHAVLDPTPGRRNVPAALGNNLAADVGPAQGSPTSADGFASESSHDPDAFSDSDVRSNGAGYTNGNGHGGAFSPASNPASASSYSGRARAASPGAESQGDAPAYASSASGSQSGASGAGADELAGFCALSVDTQQGDTSPQLPSPASNASSGTGGGSAGAKGANVADQNPPINTLYVGNLPSSPMLSYANQLEESLKDLFSRCTGFRKLCFRQKSNGPMCFVEFEDVSYATKALNDLYGNTLSGLVKNGGIRLSYSKNPLGVRTPTSANSANGIQHSHQQSLSTATSPPFLDTYTARQQMHIAGDAEPSLRRDSTTVASPTSSAYHWAMTAPPPRFFSGSPATAFATGAPSGPMASSTAFAKANPQGYTLPLGGGGSLAAFSPFGLGSAASRLPMPDQTGTLSDNGAEPFLHALPPLTT